MELHLYAPIGGCPTLDAACLAAAWLAETSDHDVKIYPSSNINVSPTGKLPALVSEQFPPIVGFPEIAAKLIDRDLTPVETALLAYCQSLSVITQWNLFVLSENYEGLTRPEISSAIPFPMQYNAALTLQHQAAANQPPKASKNKKEAKQQESVNKLHAAILEESKIKEKAAEIPRETLQRMVKLTEILSTIKPFLTDLDTHSPAKLLVTANLVLLSLLRLPTKPLAYIIDEDEQLRELRDYGRTLNFKLTKLEKQVPAGKLYSLWNTAGAYIQFLRGTWSPR